VKAAGIEPASFEVAESRMVPEPRLELGPSYEERILSKTYGIFLATPR
jgi:hypothetical protein